MNVRCIAIIPARGGSKGLPGKNARLLLGKPLVAWTIDQARRCTLFDRVFVSTDNEGIADISRACGVDIPFLRPPELARDESSVIDTVYHTLDRFHETGEDFDHVALLEPTSPLRKKTDIENAMKLLLEKGGNADALVAVGEVTESPFFMQEIKGEYLAPFLDPHHNFFRRQQVPKLYTPYGGIYISRTDALRRTGTFYYGRTIPYPVERWQNFEIDDLESFLCAEAMLRYHLNDVI